MSELRWNPLLQEWVVTATHRQDRTFLPPPDYCPLCPTAEGGFPTEIPRSEFDFVVFENKFPSFQANPPAPDVEASALYPVQPATGICEVVLYTDKHDLTLAQMPVQKIQQLVAVWRDRYLELGANQDIQYVFIFENKGEAIGVTIPHAHGQIYAFSYIPPVVAKEIDSARQYHLKNNTCLHCHILAGELEEKRRIVSENNAFVAFVPFYARFPYEVHIYAKEHRESLKDFSPEEDQALAQILKEVICRYDNLWQMSLPYIMVMHQAPTDDKNHPYCHFHIEFYPPNRTKEKLKYLAGCESGAGTFINDTLPEEKAKELRAVDIGG